jgi:hypothetical protein
MYGRRAEPRCSEDEMPEGRALVVLDGFGNHVSVCVLIPCPLEPWRKKIAASGIADRIQPKQHFADLREDVRRIAAGGRKPK